jgi:hypothetical protein
VPDKKGYFTHLSLGSFLFSNMDFFGTLPSLFSSFRSSDSGLPRFVKLLLLLFLPLFTFRC